MARTAQVRLGIIAILMASFANSPSQASDRMDDVLQTRIAETIAVMQGRRDPARTFDVRFLKDVPPEKLRSLAAQITAQGGAIEGYADFRRAAQGSATFTLRFAHATAPARIELNPNAPNLVAGFHIFGVVPGDDSLERIEAAFAALPGKAGFGIYRLGDGPPALVHGRAAREPFAIGSAFKLYVLAALARQVAEGRRRWDETVPVAGKSFPGGTIHTLPEGAPVTLHTLASLMIAISDNTATDMLVRLVGQQALAREVELAGHANPAALAPMLTTAQLFALKRAGPAATQNYARAAPDERARILAALDTASVARADPGEVFGHGPVAIDTVEWFASPADLAGMMDDLRRLGSREALEILAINPAMDGAAAASHAYVGYKGGSEDGVISMTWLLRDAAGTWSVVTGSWNDTGAPLADERFEMLMQRLARLAG